MANAGADKPARIFRDYDQAALDRELNLRGRWPEHGRFFERWARDSAAVRERLPARLDLAYGDTPAEALDLFPRSEEHTSELQSLMRISYAVFCLKKKNNNIKT